MPGSKCCSRRRPSRRPSLQFRTRHPRRRRPNCRLSLRTRTPTRRCQNRCHQWYQGSRWPRRHRHRRFQPCLFPPQYPPSRLVLRRSGPRPGQELPRHGHLPRRCLPSPRRRSRKDRRSGHRRLRPRRSRPLRRRPPRQAPPTLAGRPHWAAGWQPESATRTKRGSVATRAPSASASPLTRPGRCWTWRSAAAQARLCWTTRHAACWLVSGCRHSRQAWPGRR